MATAEPLILQTLLGSCVAVCLRDPAAGIAGMNHILLPGGCHSPRCGRGAMDLLIDKMVQLGANRRTLVAKAFGGANVIPGFQSPTVGDENIRFVVQFLAAEKIPLIAQRLGGKHAVQLSFSTDTGKVSVHTVDGSRLPVISREEESYSRTLDSISTGDVTPL
jgi:chemotaxis protein CheD